MFTRTVVPQGQHTRATMKVCTRPGKGGQQPQGSPGTCWGVSSTGSCRLMKRRRPAAPNSRMDENMQASRIVPSRGVIRGTLRGHLSGVKGTFFPHYLHQTSIRLGSTRRKGRSTFQCWDTWAGYGPSHCSDSRAASGFP